MPVGRTLIVLEDDPRARAALCLVLADWDFRTVAAASAGQALKALSAGAEDVVAIITDFDLGPGMDGVGESLALRAAGVSAPVLVISGSLSGKAAVTAREAGFQFLPKPAAPADIKRWLDAEVKTSA